MRLLHFVARLDKRLGLLEIDTGKDRFLAKLIRLVRKANTLSSESEGEVMDENAAFIERLVHVLSKRASRDLMYVVLTIVGHRGLSTYLTVIARGSSKDDVLKEAEVLGEVVGTLADGGIEVRDNEGISSQLLVIPMRATGNDFVAELHQIEVEPRSYEPSPLISSSSRGANGIYLGHLLPGEGEEDSFSIPRDSIFRHIAIFGTTGSGKTTTAAVLSRGMVCKGITVFILDWHGEYGAKLRSIPKVVLEPAKGDYLDGLTIEELISKDPQGFVDILDASLDLTPAQSFILTRILEGYDQDKHGDVWNFLNDRLRRGSFSEAVWERESRLALYRKLRQLLALPSKRRKVEVSDEPLAIVIDLSSISNTRVRRTYTHLMIKLIAFYMQHGLWRRDTAIVVDEAHNVLNEEGPISLLISEVRKWRLGFVIVTQSPSFVTTNVMKNTNTKIIHAIKSSMDLTALSKSLFIPREIEERIPFLSPGQAVVAIAEHEWPFLVKIDATALEKPCREDG